MMHSSMRGTGHAGSKASDAALVDTRTVVVYLVFGASALYIYHSIANWELSAILTMSVMAQCLSFVLLGLQISAKQSVGGVSMKTLQLDAVSLCCRLASTLVKEGYLPVDATGDWVYQAADICSLAMVLYLLYLGLGDLKRTYQAAADDFGAAKLAAGAALLACAFHGDMNHSRLFDIFWTTSVYIDAIAALPQLWMIARDGTAEALTSHHIATLIVSRLFAGTFWWIARHDVVFTPVVGDFNYAAWGVLAAYGLHLVIGADFAYYYVKACVTQGLSSWESMVCTEV